MAVASDYKIRKCEDNKWRSFSFDEAEMLRRGKVPASVYGNERGHESKEACKALLVGISYNGR